MRTQAPRLPEDRIPLKPFAKVSAATFFFFAGHTALLPVLPKHLEDLGAVPAVVGLVAGVMMLPAVVLRPFIGRHIDRSGRKLFILIGFAVSAAAGLGYYFASESVWAIFCIRLVHGVAMASYYPGASTLIGDLTPPKRRAEAFSYFSMALFAGLAAGPAIGEHIYLTAGAANAFLAGAAITFAGLGLAWSIHDPYATDKRNRPEEEEFPRRMPLLHRAALFPAVVLGLTAVAAGGSETFVALYLRAERGGDTRMFFAVFALTIIMVRFFTGGISDRYGRGVVIIPGTFMVAVSMFLLAVSSSPLVVAASAAAFGLGWGAMFPGLFALTIDRVPTHERGSATGTFTAAFDLTFGFGQIGLGALLQVTSFTVVFTTAGGLAALAGVFYLMGSKRSGERFPVLQG